MRALKILLPFLIILAFLLGCSSTTDDNNQENTDLGNVGPVDTGDNGSSDREISINPNRGYYDVVVMDIDRWELCMNLNRARYHCNSYTGHMWYQAGAFVFEGSLTAVYNYSLDLLAVAALDSGWDRGHILYSMQFIEGTNDLYGSFVYFEYPRRTNGINAWLVQGTIGPHTYTPEQAPQPSFFNPPSAIHPKGGRSLEEMGE